MAQKAIPNFVDEFTLTVAVLAQHTFSLHAELFHNPLGVDVPRIRHRPNFLQFREYREGLIEHRTGHFRRDALTPVVADDTVPDFPDAICKLKAYVDPADDFPSNLNGPGRMGRTILQPLRCDKLPGGFPCVRPRHGEINGPLGI